MIALQILLVLAALAVAAVLIRGLLSMARRESPKASNKIMQWRIRLQILALGLLFLLLLLGSNTST